MRYVIVCVVKGEAGEFNNSLRKGVFENLGAKSSKLPAHFTIKAPFEYDRSIKDLELVLEKFCTQETAQPFKLDGYDHFDDRVIYMKVNMSEGGQSMHDRLIEEMDQLPYISFDRKDGKDKIFHVTIASKKIQPIYQQLWHYVQQYPCQFECLFDNICIYHWKEHTWKLYKEFKIEGQSL